MAWENAIIENLTTGTVSGDLASWSAYHDQMTGTTTPQVAGSPFANFSGAKTYNAQQLYALNDGDFLFGDAQAGLRCEVSRGTHYLYMWYNGEQVPEYLEGISNRPQYSEYDYYARTIYVLINDDTQIGTLILMTRLWNGNWGSTAQSYGLNWNVYKTQTAVVYNWAKRLAPPPLYNWQSVSSISGKNGILQFMSTIVDMNDGDPITTSDTTKFTLVEESNVGVITEDIDDSIKPGADAGGISGSGSNSGNQSTGYAFGQGESGTNKSGGGGGLYGGYVSDI